jgi:hypothetical protein
VKIRVAYLDGGGLSIKNRARARVGGAGIVVREGVASDLKWPTSNQALLGNFPDIGRISVFLLKELDVR